MDGMDTLYLMGLHKEFLQAKEFVLNDLNLETIDSEISVFEMNIRFLGGLLTCYAFTKDQLFLSRAEQLAKNLLLAFNTPTGIPNAIVNPKQGQFNNMLSYHFQPLDSFHRKIILSNHSFISRLCKKLHVGFGWQFNSS